MHAHLTKTLRDLDAKENNLLDLVEAGGTIAAKVRERRALIGEERARLQADLAAQAPELEAGAALNRAALDLPDDPQELYRQTTDAVRRQLNQVFFGKLYLEIDEVTNDLLAEPFDRLVYRRNLHRTSIAHRRRRVMETTNGAPRDAAVSTMGPSAALLERIARGEGSSKAAMVELTMRYSNQQISQRLLSTAESIAGLATVKMGSSGPAPLPRRWRLADRLGEQGLQALLADRRLGMGKRALAFRYDMSLSSVKRLLKSAHDADRP